MNPEHDGLPRTGPGRPAARPDQSGRGQSGHGQAGRGQSGHGQAGRGQSRQGQTGQAQAGQAQAGRGQAGQAQAGPGQVVAPVAGRREPEIFPELTAELAHFMMVYKFGLAEIRTKIDILAEELAQHGTGNPIEHVNPRLKTPASITAKARRIGCPLTIDDLRGRIRDIAGIRIVCGFVSDVYTVAEMLTRQPDVNLVLTKDYIAKPKPNGYRSLHLSVEIPVFLSNQVVAVPVEVQLRTVAMDFWASLEHKIYYKHDPDIPVALLDELAAAAEDAARLDVRMEGLHREIHGPRR